MIDPMHNLFLGTSKHVTVDPQLSEHLRTESCSDI